MITKLQKTTSYSPSILVGQCCLRRGIIWRPRQSKTAAGGDEDSNSKDQVKLLSVFFTQKTREERFPSCLFYTFLSNWSHTDNMLFQTVHLVRTHKFDITATTSVRTATSLQIVFYILYCKTRGNFCKTKGVGLVARDIPLKCLSCSPRGVPGEGKVITMRCILKFSPER